MQTIIIGKGNLSHALQRKLGEENCKLLSSREIIENPVLLVDVLQQCDNLKIVINAFQKSDQIYQSSPEILIKNTIANLAVILELLIPHKHKIVKLIYTSSSAVYGANSSEKCQETTAPAPISLHGSLKLACEQLITFYCKQQTIDYTITRLFNLFGGQDDSSLIYKLIKAWRTDKQITLVNQGKALRDFIHIDDAVWTYERLLALTGVPILNIASGQGISVQTIIKQLENHDVSFVLKEMENPHEIFISEACNALTEKYVGSHQYISVFSYLLEEIALNCSDN